MGMEVGEKKGVMASPNIVPLIDVLLVLLIIFMVITPTTPMGLNALVPQPSPPNQQQSKEVVQKTIVVQVLPGDKYKINQDDVTWEQLGPRLEEIFKIRAEKVAFVKGDENVVFADVARVIDVMRSSGIDEVGLITTKLEAGQ